MKIRLLVSTIVLVIMLVLGNANYHLTAQTPAQTPAQSSAKTMNLAFMAVPQKLIEDTDATLLVYAVDSSNTPLPIKIPSLSVTSSDPSVVSIKDISSSEFDNSVKINIHAGKIGSATVTAANSGFLSSQVKIDVVGNAYEASGLLVKAVPSTFSEFGPYRGYVSVQLVNSFGNPVPADDDIVINLSSSDPNIVSLNDKVTIKRGDYFVYREFTALNAGTTLLQAEVPGKWKESAQVIVAQPTGPLGIALKVLPNIAPALQSAHLYGFAQLQDASGNPITADRDVSVNIISDSDYIDGGTGIIKKGDTHIVVTLDVNTNLPCPTLNKPCVTLTAVAKGYTSGSADVELRKPVSQQNVNLATRMISRNITAKIDPVVYAIPLLADGKDHEIGVVQMQTTKDGNVDPATTIPIISSRDIPLTIHSSDSDILEIKDAQSLTIQRGSSATLIEGKMGYKTGQPKLTIVAERFGESTTPLTVSGHAGVVLAAEPLISKIMAKSTFPLVVYFKDANGASSYSLEDMPISISKVDKPEAEIGSSTTTTEILDIQSGVIRKGSSTMLLDTESKGKGTSTVTFGGSIRDATFSTQTSITMSNQVPENLAMFIPSLILGNAKYTIPLEVIDKDGFPIKTTSDVEVLLVSSIGNVVSVPASVIIPKGQYYTTLLIGAVGQGDTEVTALANNFQSSKLNVKVTLAKPTLVLTPSSTIVKLDDQFQVTLDSKYSDIPLRGLTVKWSSDAAKLVRAEETTNEDGRAEAAFSIDHETPFTVTAEVSGYGYETSTLALNLNTEHKETSAPVQPVVSPVTEPQEQKSGNVILTMIMSNPYFFVLPAIGAVIFWLVKTERLNLPLGKLFERFRKSEE